jgi:hypothetical protein
VVSKQAAAGRQQRRPFRDGSRQTDPGPHGGQGA